MGPVKRVSFPAIRPSTRLVGRHAYGNFPCYCDQTSGGLAEREQKVDSDSLENRVMSDVAGSAKHGSLRDPTRNNKLLVASCFEYVKGRGFRFMRNAVTIAHASLGELDFMVVSLAALQYWMKQIGFSLNRRLGVSESTAEFGPSAFLYSAREHCISTSGVRIRMFEKLATGTYRPIDPPHVAFELRERT